MNSANRIFQTESPSLLQYSPEQGDEGFRYILSRFLISEFDEPVSPERLFITNGISKGINRACTILTRPHDTIFVEEPTYFYAHGIFKDHHLKVIGIPVDDGGIDNRALEKMLLKYKPSFINTIPEFHNPTSVSLSPERREKLITHCTGCF